MTVGTRRKPSKYQLKANSRKQLEFIVDQPLFADDTTLIDWLKELQEGKQIIKEEMKQFEETCHDGKDEIIGFDGVVADHIRMLGTMIGKKGGRER